MSGVGLRASRVQEPRSEWVGKLSCAAMLLAAGMVLVMSETLWVIMI